MSDAASVRDVPPCRCLPGHVISACAHHGTNPTLADKEAMRMATPDRPAASLREPTADTAKGKPPDVNDLYTHPLVRSPLASRIGWGVAEVWAIRKQEIYDGASEYADPADDPTGHAALQIILASFFVGTDVVPVAAALSLDMRFVAECAGRLREANVWLQDNTMFYPWLDKFESGEGVYGLILDSLVATGTVVKVGPDSYLATAAGATS